MPEGRLQALRARLAAEGLDALLVSRRENVRYLTGFTGSAGAVLITADEAVLATDSRYAEQAQAEAPGCRVAVEAGVPSMVAARLAGPGRLGFESEALTHDLWQRIASPGALTQGVDLVACRGMVERLRVRKDAAEIARIVRAIEITSRAFAGILPRVKPGAVERDLALELESAMKRDGAEELAFDLIVASGPRSALPHGRASGRRLGEGEFVVFDIGARFEGYHSDMTRTVYLGRPGPEARELYSLVLEAQLAGIAAVRPGAACSEVDRAARSVIEAAGLADRFGHGTGHGVGLEIHEAPRVAARSAERLEPGMVITIEPGVYHPGQRGVRIEDIVLVTESGGQVLTPSPKETWALE